MKPILSDACPERIVEESDQVLETSKRRGRRPIAGLTEHQLRTLRAIQQYVDEHGIPPTAAELSTALGLTRSTIQDQIEQLVRKGCINRESGRARSISVLREPNGILQTYYSVPIVGTVAAGEPIFAEENVIGEILIESSALRGARHFALRVQGSSMTGAGIEPDDLIIVRQQASAETGDVVVTMVNGDATVKRLWMVEGKVELRPENTDFDPIVLGPGDELRLIGKVIAVRRLAVEQG
jgi:repressor LexA